MSTDTGESARVVIQSVPRLNISPDLISHGQMHVSANVEAWAMKHEMHTDKKLNSNTLLHGDWMWNFSQWVKPTGWQAMVGFFLYSTLIKTNGLTRNPWDLVNATNLKAPKNFGAFKISIRDLFYIFPSGKNNNKNTEVLEFLFKGLLLLSSWDAKTTKAPCLGCWTRHQKLIVWSFSKWISSNDDTKTQWRITDARGAWLSLDSRFSMVSIFAGEAWVSRRTFFAYSRGALWTYDGTLATYEHRSLFLGLTQLNL